MELSELQTLRLRQPKRLAIALSEGIVPLRVDWGENDSLSLVHFSDDRASFGSCIRCARPPCMEYSSQELEFTAFRDFPADKNEALCPTGAITWPMEEDAPIIDPHTCISCGLCVSRCPTRAIFLDEYGAHVNDEPNDHFHLQEYLTTEENTEAVARLFDNVIEEGSYRVESEEIFSHFLAHFKDVAKDQSAQFPNHLARNLLIANGIRAAMRRRGDTNIRMEMVLGPPGVVEGTGDVELGAGVLDAPRNILDNVAVLVARYEASKSRIWPLIVSLSLPNQRVEYWQVIKDIRSVLDIKINSVTIGVLVLLVWNRAKLVIREGEELYVDADSTSLRPKIEAILGRTVNVVSGYPGFLESEK